MFGKNSNNYRSSSQIEKTVRRMASETLKRNLKQADELQKYLMEADEAPDFSNEKIIDLWQELGEEINKEDNKNLNEIEEKIVRANLKKIVSTAKEYSNKYYIKPYFTFLELIKEGERGLRNAIRNYHWPQHGVTHKTSVAPVAIAEYILEVSNRTRYKIVTGKEYTGKLNLNNTNYIGHPILNNSSLMSIEELLSNDWL